MNQPDSEPGPTAPAPTGDLGPELAATIMAGLRDVPDFPQPGVLFRDIMPLLADADGFGAVIAALAAVVRSVVDADDDSDGRPVDLIAGIEARGFILAAALARELGAGLLPIRKAGKLPPPVVQQSYDLEYGSATIETSLGLMDGKTVFLVDDVLATGGTLVAAAELIRRAGGTLTGVGMLIELGFLGGRKRFRDAVSEQLPLATLLAL